MFIYTIYEEDEYVKINIKRNHHHYYTTAKHPDKSQVPADGHQGHQEGHRGAHAEEEESSLHPQGRQEVCHDDG